MSLIIEDGEVTNDEQSIEGNSQKMNITSEMNDDDDDEKI